MNYCTIFMATTYDQPDRKQLNRVCFLSLILEPAYPFLDSLLVAQDTTTNCVSAFTFFFFFT